MKKGPLAAAALLLAACSEAGAQSQETPQPEAVQVAALTSKTKTRTMAECRVLADRTKKRACMIAAQDAQQALRDAQHATELAAVDRKIETERETGRELDTTNDVLSSEIDQIYREAAQSEDGDK